ncbi:MAG: hypothetical protein ABS81_01005 [Pseudonocardia sp. SCN 72-86]|nr:MAG: hypothetical protein ABS81_01005 [Pseudonocardia sp. SCN 72-86]
MRIALPARLRSRRSAVAGLAVLVAFVLVAVLADVIAPGDPLAGTGPPFAPPSGAHWFGTDSLGRDVFAGVVHASRATLVVGLASAALAAAVGTVVGGISGYAGGLVDDVLMRLVEVVEIVPRFFLAVVLAALFGPSVPVVVLLLGFTLWPETARLLRAEVLSIRHRDFVVAGRASGLSPGAVLVRHVLPNAAGVVVVSGALHVGTAVLVQAGLAFLGLVDASTLSWGGMLQSAQGFVTIAWWPAVFPGLALSLLVVSANLLGDGLLAALSIRGPRSRAL